MEPAELAEARKTAELKQWEALYAERERTAHWRKEKDDGQWLETLARLDVQVSLLRHLAAVALTRYCIIAERAADPAYAQGTMSQADRSASVKDWDGRVAEWQARQCEGPHQ